MHENKNVSGVHSEDPRVRAICIKADEQNEKISELIYFAIVKVSSPYLVLPSFVYSFYMYFATDSKNDAFILPIPTW